MNKPFSYNIYQLGKRLYQQKKIFDYSCNQHFVSARVMDVDQYVVKLVFDNSNHLIGKTCTCNYSMQHGECKHCASVFIKTVEENQLNNEYSSLRDFYHVFLSKKNRRETDYKMFENTVKNKLNEFIAELNFEKIKAYVSEFSKLTYSESRKGIVLDLFYKTFNQIKKSDNLKKEFFLWEIDSLTQNKYLPFQEYFLNDISNLPKEECQSICEQLLENMSVMLNDELCSKILYVLYNKNDDTLEEFIQKYSRFDQLDAMVCFRARLFMAENKYAEVLHLLKPLMRRKDVSKEIKLMFEQAEILENPKKIINSKLARVNSYWPDFQVVYELREMFGDNWEICKEYVYDCLKEKVRLDTLCRYLVEFNEKEYALKLVFKEPEIITMNECVDLLDGQYMPMISLGYTHECAKHYSSFSYAAMEEFLTQMNLYEPQMVDHIIYHLQKKYPENEKLIKKLDEIGEEYED